MSSSKNGWRSDGLVCDMIIKVVLLFLIGMIVLAMFGKFKFPGQKQIEAARCKACGRFRIGRACACPKKK